VDMKNMGQYCVTGSIKATFIQFSDIDINDYCDVRTLNAPGVDKMKYS
jgi:hypothetical protein